MKDFINYLLVEITNLINEFDFADGVALGFIFILNIFIFLILNKNNASKVSVTYACFIVVTSFISLLTELTRQEYMILVTSFIICVILLFATEIKRSVWNVKVLKPHQSRDVSNAVRSSAKAVTYCINEIIKAVQTMAKNDVGAIIVLSNTKIPDNIINSGVKLDANISSAIIESVFFPKTPLHDGAMIIQNDKVLAASCFLPLSQETDLPKELGTRHRAGIGITEVLNVTSIIVSEETGIISYAQGGKLTRYADSEMLRKVLKAFYWQDLIGTKQGVEL